MPAGCARIAILRVVGVLLACAGQALATPVASQGPHTPPRDMPLFTRPSEGSPAGHLATEKDTAPARVAAGGSETTFERVLASNWVLGEQEARHGKPLHWEVWVPPVASAIVLGVVGLAIDPPRNARWVGQNGFDDGIRDGLEAGSPSGRNSAVAASHAFFGVLGGALLVDRALARDTYPLAKSLGSDLTWFLSNGIATQVAKVSAGRQRPFVEPCAVNPDHISDCDAGRDGNGSFFSGHASFTATLAGLLCSRHRDLLTWDGLWCIGGIGGAAATGLLRITADQHWATDVIAGWSVGAAFGFVLPSYVWPTSRDTTRDPSVPATSLAFHLRAISPVASQELTGLRYEIRF